VIRYTGRQTIGDAYCFVAIERHSKLVLNFVLGRRSRATTDIFIEGLRDATASQNFQITTDGFAPYVNAISDTLGDRAATSRSLSRSIAHRVRAKRATARRGCFGGGGPSHG
jgi:IS1 family transposase